MKVRKQFTARVAGTNTMLPGRTRKPERHAELVGVTAIEGTPWFSAAMQVPYRGGLAQAGVKEGDTMTFTATLAGEESERVMSYVVDVVVLAPAPLPAPAPSTPTPLVNEVVTATVTGYGRNSEGPTLTLKDITDAAGVVRRTTAEVPHTRTLRMRHLNIGDIITCTATLVFDRLDITEVDIVKRYRRLREDEETAD